MKQGHKVCESQARNQGGNQAIAPRTFVSRIV